MTRSTLGRSFVFRALQGGFRIKSRLDPTVLQPLFEFTHVWADKKPSQHKHPLAFSTGRYPLKGLSPRQQQLECPGEPQSRWQWLDPFDG